MKNIYLIVLVLFMGINIAQAQTLKNEKVFNLLSGKVELKADQLDVSTPIVSFKTIAEKNAAKVIDIKKDNIKEALAEAKNYTACVITVRNHTIVLITDLTKCIQSGSWATCMPYGKGLIQKRGMTERTDYINNIIGIPDSQERKMYLFK